MALEHLVCVWGGDDAERSPEGHDDNICVLVCFLLLQRIPLTG